MRAKPRLKCRYHRLWECGCNLALWHQSRLNKSVRRLRMLPINLIVFTNIGGVQSRPRVALAPHDFGLKSAASWAFRVLATVVPLGDIRLDGSCYFASACRTPSRQCRSHSCRWSGLRCCDAQALVATLSRASRSSHSCCSPWHSQAKLRGWAARRPIWRPHWRQN